MDAARPVRARKLTQKMSDLTKEFQQQTDVVASRETAEATIIVPSEPTAEKRRTMRSSRKSAGRAPGEIDFAVKDLREDKRAGDWDPSQVYPLDRGKVGLRQDVQAQLDIARAFGVMSTAATVLDHGNPLMGTSPNDSDGHRERADRQARLDLSIKHHRQMMFGVPVNQQEEESFLTLSSISYFFDDPNEIRPSVDKDNEGGQRRSKRRNSSQRWQDVMIDHDGQYNGLSDNSDSSPRPSGSRRRLSEPGKRKRDKDVEPSPSSPTEKRSKRSKSLKPNDGKRKSKEKPKESKAWKMGKLPEIPGFEYTEHNIYKCRKPKLERIMGCESCRDSCNSCPCRAAQMECCHEGEDPCKCSAKCMNQRLIKGKVAPIIVVKTKHKGYGVIADADIEPRSLVVEYVGEVISETEKNRRMKRRDDDDNCYFMELYSQKVSMHRRPFVKKIEGIKIEDVTEVVKNPSEQNTQDGDEQKHADRKKQNANKLDDEYRDPKSRKGLKLACSNCRTSHLACSHETPCNRCVEKGMADTCVYIPKRRRRTYQQIEEDKRREREKEKKKREEQQRKEMEAEASSKTGKSLGLITSRERLLRSFESKRVDESDDEENGTHRSEKGTVKSEGEPPRYEGNEEEELAELLCKFGTSSTSGAAALDSDDGHSKSDEDEYKEEEEMSSGEEGGNEEGEVKLGAMTRRWYVDACERGNAARFINHSCQPNCVVERWQCGEHMRLGIFAAQKIKKGEEITYDYAFQYDINERDKKTKKRQCYCGAPNCEGTI